jgi:hypothetical protein
MRYNQPVANSDLRSHLYRIIFLILGKAWTYGGNSQSLISKHSMGDTCHNRTIHASRKCNHASAKGIENLNKPSEVLGSLIEGILHEKMIRKI